MPQTCTICRHPQRLEVEQALLNRTALRSISDQYGPSKTALLRHKNHIAGVIAQQTQAREVKRVGTLMDDVRVGEGRAERLYAQAEAILAAALQDQDRRSALQAIRAAVDVMGEARNLMEIRGELTGELDRDRGSMALSIQIVCPSAPDPANAPRISFASYNAIDAAAQPVEDSTQDIGLLQLPG